MKYSKKYKMISTMFAIGLLSGCGTYVPDLQEFYEAPHDVGPMVEAVVEQVQCEVQTGVQFLILDDIEQAEEDPEVARALKAKGLKVGRKLSWLDTWAAQVTLTLTIDEKSALNPGVAFNTPMIPAVTSFPGKITVTTPQSYSLGLGGTFSTDATRKETLSWFIDFSKFTDKASLKKAKLVKDRLEQAAKETGANSIIPCNQENGIFIQSDLKLREWIYDVMLPTFVQSRGVPDYANALKTEAKKSKKDVISHEITFVIIDSGNITPSWKLVRVSTNQGSLPLLSAQRSRTQDLLITMGPPQDGALATAAQNSDLAAKIGVAVANAIRNTQ
jgi:hypothetical protein